MGKVNIYSPVLENKSLADLSTFVGVAVLVFSFAFYVFTLAPTVIWGDNAGNALSAVRMDLSIGADSHPLFIILGHLFFYLPFEPAYCLNLLSAVTSSLAVLIVYLIVREMTGSMASAIIGAISLCVSHAFWLHAVIGRIYGLNIFFVMVLVLILLRWRKEPTNNCFLYLAAFFFGLGLSNHLIMAFTIIGFLFFIVAINYRVFLSLKVLLTGVLSFLIGSSILVYKFILLLMEGRSSVPSMIDATMGGEYKKGMLIISPKIFIDIFKYFSYLFYQFPVIGFSLIFIGIYALFKKDRIVTIFLLLLIGVNAFFFISFGPGIERTTKYTFYISDYAVFSILIGYGFFTFMNYIKNKGHSQISIFLGMALIIILPLLLYNVTPYASKALGIDLLHARTIPYRDNETFFLNPSKRNYTGAARYAEEALNTASLHSIIIADFTPYTVLRYFQQTKGTRSDISVLNSRDKGENDTQKVVYKYYGKRDIYLANVEKGYYKIGRLKDEYDFVPEGVLYRVVKKSTDGIR